MSFAVLLTLGLCIILYFTCSLVTAFRRTKPPKGWAVAEGTMLLIRGNEALLPSRLNRIPEIMLTYRYEVNGVEYTGTWYGLIPGLKNKLLQAEQLEVYYDPLDPTVTFLQGKVPPLVISVHLSLIILGWIIAAAALYA